MDVALRNENRYTLKAQGLKRCHRCREVRTLASFEVQRTKRGTVVYLRSICRACDNLRLVALRARQRADPAWYSRTLVVQLRSRAKTAGLPFALTADDLHALWVHQDGRCYYTGWALDFTARTPTGRSPARAAPSIDRLVPAKGYVQGNVVWTSYALNRMKNDLTYEEFCAFCRAVAERHQW